MDVTFCISPKPRTVSPESIHSFIPSLRLKGETYLTTSDVLSSRQLVQGRCDVIYWIEAKFQQDGNTVRELKCALDMSRSAAPLQFQVTAESKCEHIAAKVKPLKWPMVKRGWPLRWKKDVLPKMTVHLPKDLGLVYRVKSGLDSHFQVVAVPLLFNVVQSAAGHRSIHDTMSNLLPEVSVEAIWHTEKVFSTSNLTTRHNQRSSVRSSKISIRSVVKQTQVLSLPPFYQKQAEQGGVGTSNAEFSATGVVNLLLPETVKCPTVNTALLKVSYALQLLVSVEGKGDGGVTKCAASLKVPLFIEST